MARCIQDFGIYGVATTFLIAFEDGATADELYIGTDFAAGDVKISKDGGALANVTNLPTQITASQPGYSIALTATEMQAGRILVTFRDASAAAWKGLALLITTRLQVGEIKADATQIGGNVDAISGQGVGTGAGLRSKGGLTGHGIYGIGGDTSGAGVRGDGGATVGSGFSGNGTGAGSGFAGTGGPTGAGFAGAGGGTSGAGLALTVQAANQSALTAAGAGTGSGIDATGGATGYGIYGKGGATSGTGIYGQAINTGHGIQGAGFGTGNGIQGAGGATGHGIGASGGATSGNGIAAVGTGGFNGILAIGQGVGHGFAGVAGASGKISNFLDALEGAEPTSVPDNATFAQILQLMKRRMFNKATAAAGMLTLFRDNSSTTLFTQSLTNDGTTVTRLKAA